MFSILLKRRVFSHNLQLGQNNNSSKIITLFISSFIAAALLYAPLHFANSVAIEAFDEENFKDAKTLFEQSLEKNKKDVVSLQYLARIAHNDSRLDDAEEYIEQAQDLASDNASIQYDFAQIMASQAQDVSIFSAPGYAKRSLSAFNKAVVLEPSNIDYRQALMNFYLFAPGIVGGDEDLALKEAQAIEILDPEKGLLVMATVYRATDEDTKLEDLYRVAEKKFPKSFGITFQRGMYFQSQEKFEPAFSDFQKIQTFKAVDDEDKTTQYAALYQIGRSSVLSDTKIDQGISALLSYIDIAPQFNSLPSLSWAKYRLGLLYANKGEKKISQNLYREAKAATKDKSLRKLLKRKIKKMRY